MKKEKKIKEEIKEKIKKIAGRYNIKLPSRLISDTLIEIIPRTMKFRVKYWWDEPKYITVEAKFFLTKEDDYFTAGYEWWHYEDRHTEIEVEGETLFEVLGKLFIEIARRLKTNKNKQNG